MSQHDTLQRFLFDGAPVRGALVRLDGAWQQVLARQPILRRSRTFWADDGSCAADVGQPEI
jgi:redox-regulated HSP33 family molecular chaperone